MANEPMYRCARCGSTQDKPWRCPGCDSVDMVPVPLARREPLTEREIAYGQEVARLVRQQEAEERVIAAARAIAAQLAALEAAGYDPVRRYVSGADGQERVSPAGVTVPGALLLELQEALAALDALRGM